MKKRKIILLIAFIILITQAFAQSPTITNAVVPVIGDSYDAYQFANTTDFIYSDSGANVVWDFSTLTPYGSSIQTNIISPIGTPFPPAYSVSDFVATDGANYGYFSSSNNAISKVGLSGNYDLCTNFSMLYYGGMDYIRFPMNYLDSYVDSFVSAFVITCDTVFPGNWPGHYDVVADAYGTLITPFDTFTNCLRLKERWWMTIGSNSITRDPVYFWYNNDYHFPLFVIDSLGFGTDRQSVTAKLNRKNQASSSFESEISTAIKFKQLNNETIQLEIPLEYSAEEFFLVDELGRIILKKNIKGLQTFQLNTNGFVSGIYFFGIKDANQKIIYEKKWCKLN